MLNLRLRVRAKASGLRLEAAVWSSARCETLVEMPGEDAPVPQFERSCLAPGDEIAGPALIVEEVSTTWLAGGWNCRVDGHGNLLLERPAHS